MRVIAGLFKGRKLVDFKAEHIRPTTDRVKESLFNILQAFVPESQVLDLFSGTGSLGIEALSRGAKAATFVDDNVKSLKILRANLSLLEIEAQAQVVRADAIEFLKKPGSEFDLVLIDPPFTKSMADEVLLHVGSSPRVKEGARIAIESAKKELIKDSYPGLQLLDRRPFGDKTLSLYKKTSVK
jgi:16S rRNA (guanine966-N2)-methyltransferase